MNKIEQIQSDIQMNRNLGSRTMAHSLAKLVLQGELTEMVAQSVCEDSQREELRNLLGRTQEQQESQEVKKPSDAFMKTRVGGKEAIIRTKKNKSVL